MNLQTHHPTSQVAATMNYLDAKEIDFQCKEIVRQKRETSTMLSEIKDFLELGFQRDLSEEDIDFVREFHQFCDEMTTPF